MPTARKPYVYIAGPMTLGDMADNIRRAIRAAESVLAWGGIPYVPQTTFFWHLISPHVHDYWMSLDLPWLAKCDVVIRLEGASVGADREVAEANTLQIPVVTFDGFLPWLDQWRAAEVAPLTFGSYFRDLRHRQGTTLREFCSRHDLNPGNISKLERDLISPPLSNTVLRRYADALDLIEDTAEWRRFFELATIARGLIPNNIMDDRALLARLPLIFHALAGQPVSADQVDELSALIRRSEAAHV